MAAAVQSRAVRSLSANGPDGFLMPSEVVVISFSGVRDQKMNPNIAYPSLSSNLICKGEAYELLEPSIAWLNREKETLVCWRKYDYSAASTSSAGFFNKHIFPSPAEQHRHTLHALNICQIPRDA